MIDQTLHSYDLTLSFLRRMVADVPDELLSHQSGGAVNHPAWVIGHLVYSCQAIGGEIGLQPWLSADWPERFGTGSVASDDRSLYPSKQALLDALAEGRRKLADRLLAIGNAGLAEPLPDERFRQMFPTLGHAVLHILVSHASVHVGQVTVWRRAVGLGPINATFV